MMNIAYLTPGRSVHTSTDVNSGHIVAPGISPELIQNRRPNGSGTVKQVVGTVERSLGSGEEHVMTVVEHSDGRRAAYFSDELKLPGR